MNENNDQVEEQPCPLRVFLSYADEDKEAIQDLYRRLHQDGFDPWMSAEDLQVGQERENTIQQSMQTSDVVIICLSQVSVSQAGRGQREIRRALEMEEEQPEGVIFLLPARLEPCEIPGKLQHLQGCDLFQPQGYEQLSKALRTRTQEMVHISPPSTRHYPSIVPHIRNFSQYILTKTAGFVGRRFVFDAISEFTQSHPRGYFIVRGDPGIGKSALAAQMVKQHGYVHHFNIYAEGVNLASHFFRNVCARLITTYRLPYTALQPDVDQDNSVFKRLLEEVSEGLQDGRKAMIVVDALDEVDTTGQRPGINTLHLPITLPDGIYIVATTRRGDVRLRIDCEQRTLDIEQNSADNLADIRAYIEHAVPRSGIQQYRVPAFFEGNFTLRNES
jgi:hypothetical protein